MKDKIFFLDTNIFIYALSDINHTQGLLNKFEVADSLIKSALATGHGVISFQVVQEFLNTCCKLKLNEESSKKVLQKILQPLWKINSNPELYYKAQSLHKKTRFSFYDSLIISAALQSNAKILYSEDMHSGFKIDGLTILNPFL